MFEFVAPLRLSFDGRFVLPQHAQLVASCPTLLTAEAKKLKRVLTRVELELWRAVASAVAGLLNDDASVWNNLLARDLVAYRHHAMMRPCEQSSGR
eukprot:3841293-Pleurochrysis_carterae.AAC.1